MLWNPNVKISWSATKHAYKYYTFFCKWEEVKIQRLKTKFTTPSFQFFSLTVELFGSGFGQHKDGNWFGDFNSLKICFCKQKM